MAELRSRRSRHPRLDDIELSPAPARGSGVGEARDPRPSGGEPNGSTPRRTARDGGATRGATGTYLWRRVMAVGLVLLGFVALMFAVFSQSPGEPGEALPIDASIAGPDTVLAETSGVAISTPVRPASLTALGYHPKGETLLELTPRGENLSRNPLLSMFSRGSTPEDIRYHMMDPAERAGPRTGALDVGAEAGDTVYAPVSGVITAIRPDPTVKGANVVEIEPTDNPNVRVSISLVRDIEDGTGLDTPVTAGSTELGVVADSAEVLEPQLAGITGEAGNHVTVSATMVG
jgi:hypothetical protein